MSAQIKETPAKTNGQANGSVVGLLESRASKEFVIGVMGAVGCGLASIVTEFQVQLVKLGYQVVRVKMSTFIASQIQSQKVTVPTSDMDNRYLKYQTGGNELRRLYGHEIMAKYAINQIGRNRLAIDPDLKDLTKEPPRIAYIIDQIKHPDEVVLLRTVYRNNFYLVGVMSLEANRKTRLKDEGLTPELIEHVVNRDRKEGHKFGQQLEKAFKLADYFIHHPLGVDEAIPEQVERFIHLTHGDNAITPTKHEHAMYVAYSTAMKSSCLSRQVGASITDIAGRLIAVGTNDVPQYKGGLYSSENPADDRCFKTHKICENNAEKKRRFAKIKSGIETKFAEVFKDGEMAKVAEANVDAIADFVYEQSGIPDLIEFSRAVHAEMDALISLTRGGGGSTVGGSLYATTFPCHNCARHIIAAGIDKVFYIEPYEKSLAPEAHKDAIEVLDHDNDSAANPQAQHTRLRFVHFSGVGPRMYTDFFQRDTRKNDSGDFLPNRTISGEYPIKIIHEYIDPHRVFEVKVATLFDKEFPAATSAPVVVPVVASPVVTPGVGGTASGAANES
jgi:deoxycytidylate deaminase